MLVAGIKSRPVYGGLNDRRHTQGGTSSPSRAKGRWPCSTRPRRQDRNSSSKPTSSMSPRARKAEDHDRKLAALGADDFWLAPTIPVLLNRLNVMLGQAHMGTRIYIAGTEGFIGQAMQVAMNHGVDPASIHTEHRGSAARRVQCVHCKGITDNVTTSPYTCTHCGLSLLVRDHYSRRIGAFQGVCIDAEEPGTAPKPEELFP